MHAPVPAVQVSAMPAYTCLLTCHIILPLPYLQLYSDKHAQMQVRVPTTIVSSICDDRGEEPTYNKVTMSTLMTGDYNVGDVISLLWFKRQLPKYATRFIEMVLMLCADHGPCVSGETASPALGQV